MASVNTLLSGLPSQAFKNNKRFRTGWDYGHHFGVRMFRLYEQVKALKLPPQQRGAPASRLSRPLQDFRDINDIIRGLLGKAIEEGPEALAGLRDALQAFAGGKRPRPQAEDQDEQRREQAAEFQEVLRQADQRVRNAEARADTAMRKLSEAGEYEARAAAAERKLAEAGGVIQQLTARAQAAEAKLASEAPKK